MDAQCLLANLITVLPHCGRVYRPLSTYRILPRFADPVLSPSLARSPSGLMAKNNIFTVLLILSSLFASGFAATCTNLGLQTFEVSKPSDVLTVVDAVSCDGGNAIAYWRGEVQVPVTIDVAETSKLHIIGGDKLAAIDGGNGLPLFDVDRSGELHLQNIILRNGNASESGRVHGGAVKLYWSTFTALDCVFENNFAAARGGAIYSSGSTMKLEKTEFVEGQAGERGGCLQADRGKCSIVNSSFTGCFAGEEGGGARMADGEFSVVNTTFANNAVFLRDDSSIEEQDEPLGRAGGLSISNCIADCTILQNVFEGNFAGYKGGAMSVAGSKIVSQKITIEACYFLNNTAGKTSRPFKDYPVGEGGAITVSPEFGMELVLANCIFRGNLAGSKGGGVVGADNSNVEIQSSQFSSNEALGFRGGCVSLNEGSALVVINSSFLSNYAADSGGCIAISEDSTSMLRDNFFYENSAHEVFPGDATLKNCLKATL
ncbi:unnamed protein product [Discosporangium mesarthrocarpum]